MNVILSDLERYGRYFYGIDNGQSTILYYIDEATASELRALTADPLVRMVQRKGVAIACRSTRNRAGLKWKIFRAYRNVR